LLEPVRHFYASVLLHPGEIVTRSFAHALR
jgi:hypothetical protein